MNINDGPGINRYGDVWTFHFGTNDKLAGLAEKWQCYRVF
jgi:hypothetical protein